MSRSPSSCHKVLVIGSGIGGLSVAIILSKLGFAVTVLEKNARPGGLMRSYLREGIACSVGVHYLGSLDRGQILRKFFDYLGVSDAIPVKKMGEDGVIDRYLFKPGSGHPQCFDLPPGLDRLEEVLNNTFPNEKKGIGEIIQRLNNAARQLHNLDLLYGENNELALLDQAGPMGEFLDALNCSPGLRSVLAIPACWLGVPLADCPAYLHSMALASYVSSSYRLDCSGSDMADALAQRLLALGGTILTGAIVEGLDIDSRTMRGVYLQSGEFLAADTVIGAVHPKIILAMLPQGAVRPSYRQRISSLKETHGIFCVHASLDANHHPEIPYNIFNIDRKKNSIVTDLRYYQVRKTEKKDKNLLSILTSGNDKRWIQWKGTKSRCRGKEYVARKKDFALQLIREAELVFGPFKGLHFLDAYTPLTLRDWVNSPDGSAYGVERSASQTLAAALLNRTSVKGLYLAGQNVMAPGIIGTILGSLGTVKLILGNEEFKRKIQL